MSRFVVWSLVVGCALVSCGEVKGDGMLADAPTSDDAAVDAAPGPVKATVLSTAADGLPDTTAKVLFLNPDGSVIADLAVDASGKAQAMMPLGGTVVAIRVTTDTPTNLAAQVTMTLGVKPGDDLTFGLKAAPTITNQGGQTTMTANFTPVTAAATAGFYSACTTASAGDAGDPIKGVATMSFRDSCHGATFDLLGIASGGNLPQPQFIKLTGVNYASGGTFTIPGSFINMASFTANFTNVPDAISSLTLSRSSMLGNVPVAAQSSTAADPPAGAYAVTVRYPQTVGTRSDLVATLARADSRSSQTFNVRTDTLASSVTMDLGALQLPWITNLALTPTGATWTTVDPGGTPDGMLSQLATRWTAGEVATSVLIRVIQPAELAGVTYPKLPTTYARLDPQQQTAAVTGGPFAMVYGDYDKLAGYDELRQMGETLLLGTPTTLGAFVGMPYQRRLSTAVLLIRL